MLLPSVTARALAVRHRSHCYRPTRCERELRTRGQLTAAVRHHMID